MLHRGPVVITTLEEDFKKIGLMSPKVEEPQTEETEETEETETEETEKAPVPAAKVEAKKSAKAEAEEEDEDEDEGDEDEEEEGDDAEEAVEGDDGDEMDEARRVARRVAAGTRGKLTRTKRTPPSLRMKAKRYYKKMKRALKRAFAKKMRKPAMRRRAKILKTKAAKRRGEGAETIANLIEDVQSIMHSLDFNAGDAMKSFANIAIISDMLANTFTEWQLGLNEAAAEEGEELEYGEYDSYVESLSDLAERAAEVATLLKNGDGVEGGVEELEALFKEYMADMLEGMDAYNTVAEQSDTMKGAKGMRVASKGEADEGEDDEGEAEESARPSKR